MGRDALVRRAATVSVCVAAVLLVVKVLASELTGSLAVWSDALESIIHIASLAFMWFAVRLAQEPPDKSHPFGHGKVESFSVALEGTLIFAAGVAIIWTVGHGLWHSTPNELQRLDIGILLILGGAILNTVLGLWLLRVGKKHDSMVIIADGHHILSDAWTSWGVVLGVFVVSITEIYWIDKLVALLVAFHLIYIGLKLVAKAMRTLMDAANPKVIKKVVDAINAKRDPAWIDMHALRVHSVGKYHHVDFHLVVPGEWTIEHAHDISHVLEAYILEQLQGEGSVIVHLDPKGENDKYREVFTVERALREDQYELDD